MTGFLPVAIKQIVVDHPTMNIFWIRQRDLRDCLPPLPVIWNHSCVDDCHEFWQIQDIDNRRKLFELYDDMYRKIEIALMSPRNWFPFHCEKNYGLKWFSYLKAKSIGTELAIQIIINITTKIIGCAHHKLWRGWFLMLDIFIHDTEPSEIKLP